MKFAPRILLLGLLGLVAMPALAQDKPNILIIWGAAPSGLQLA